MKPAKARAKPKLARRRTVKAARAWADRIRRARHAFELQESQRAIADPE